MTCDPVCDPLNVFTKGGCVCHIEQYKQLQGDGMTTTMQRGGHGRATAGVNASGVSGYTPGDSDAAKRRTEGNLR